MPTVAVLPFYRIGSTPLALEIMRIYSAGSSVYASVYADAAGTVPLGNSDLVPIQADGNGLFPVVFVPINAAYDIKFYSVDLVPRDTYEGIKPAGGSGGVGVDNYTVMVDGADSAAGYLQDKLLNSPGVTWVVVDSGGYKQIQPQIQAAAILDGKVKVSAGDGVPGYLEDKLLQGHYISLTTVGNQVQVAFSGPDYVPVSGGIFEGAVTFQDLLLAPGGAVLYNTIVEGMLNVEGPTTLHQLFAGNTIVQGSFALPGIPGTGDWLTIDLAGNVSRAVLPNLDDHLVLASGTDTVPGTLAVKLQAGAGMVINNTVDPVLGEIRSISMINVPVPIVIPVKRIVLGSGTGVTSYANLTYYNKQLIADAVSIETFYTGAGSYAGFSNAEVRTVGTRNFRDGFTQYADGTIRIGANGDYGAIKITDSSKIIDTNIDTTLRVGGKFVPKGVEISTNTYTLPELTVDGEQQVIRFTANTGTTVTASATQSVRYRAASTGVYATAVAGAQVDSALIFGKHASSKVVTLTLTRVDATTVQATY